MALNLAVFWVTVRGMVMGAYIWMPKAQTGLTQARLDLPVWISVPLICSWITWNRFLGTDGCLNSKAMVCVCVCVCAAMLMILRSGDVLWDMR